jgi:hypothetical protein
MKDFSIYASGNGGELLFIDDDLNLAESLLQQVYIALFGGNVEGVTLGNEREGDLRKDWWGNSLLFGDETAKQMNSLTEKTLKTIALSSLGRVAIQNSVNEDLAFLNRIVDVSADVSIKDRNRLIIYVRLNRYKGKEDVLLQFLWDNIQNTLIINKEI